MYVYLKVVMIDSSMAGASGDKILSALVGTGLDTEVLENAITKALLSANIEGFVKFEKSESCGMPGFRMRAELDNTPMSAQELSHNLDLAAEALKLSEWGRKIVKKALDLLLEAETKVHGSAHLHEVGEADTMVDIIGTVKAAELLGLQEAEFYSTPLELGCGSTESEHGTIPVPAPSTLKILESSGVPLLISGKVGELTTPTGAALVSALTDGKHASPGMVVGIDGIGLGTKEFSFPNITRIMIGDNDEGFDRILVIETNVDDVSGEILGWLIERLQGIVEDISILPMLTKKNRPGFTIRVVASKEQAKLAKEVLISETGTLGLKVFECQRQKVDRKISFKKVNIGGRSYNVRIKKSEQGKRSKVEFEDVKEIAKSEGASIREIMDEITRQVK